MKGRIDIVIFVTSIIILELRFALRADGEVSHSGKAGQWEDHPNKKLSPPDKFFSSPGEDIRFLYRGDKRKRNKGWFQNLNF